MSDRAIWTNTSTTASANPEDMSALVRKVAAWRDEDDRKLFVFDGSWAEFLILLRREGVEECLPLSGVGWLRAPLAGLTITAAIVGRKCVVLIGTREAIRRAYEALTGPNPPADLEGLARALTAMEVRRLVDKKKPEPASA
jgi:hypothetical protein